jgi:alkyl hydroperoxide reductase subunit AhpC
MPAVMDRQIRFGVFARNAIDEISPQFGFFVARQQDHVEKAIVGVGTRTQIKFWSDVGAEILSISTDSAYVHKAWHDQSPSIKKIQYPMIADPTAKLCRYFGTYMEEVGTSLRASFIIDPDGVIRASEFHDNSIGRNADEILRKLQAAIFVRGHEGEVCPANWRPGKKTLRPAVDLVGKI